VIFVQMELSSAGLRFVDLDDTTKEIIKQNFREGEMIDCELKKHSNSRSALQQGLFHELVGRYCLKHNVKFYVQKWRWKLAYGQHKTYEEIVETGPPSFTRGEWVDMSKIYPAMAGYVFLKSEGAYTTRESSDITNHALTDCQENDVYVDDIVLTLAKNEKRKHDRA